MREAKLFTMIYNLHTQQLALAWEVSHYSQTELGEKGEYLKVIPNCIREAIADNNTMCQIPTGVPIYKTYDTGAVDDQNEPIMDYEPGINYTGQFDFFYMLASTQPIKVNEMIINFGQLVDWTKND